MELNWKQIYEGWRNQLIPPSHLKEQIKETSKERTEICKKCEFNSVNRANYKTIRVDEHCTKCSCPISSKTKCLSCRCPLPTPKWNAVISRAQENEIIENEKFEDT